MNSCCVVFLRTKQLLKSKLQLNTEGLLNDTFSRLGVLLNSLVRLQVESQV